MAKSPYRSTRVSGSGVQKINRIVKGGWRPTRHAVRVARAENHNAGRSN